MMRRTFRLPRGIGATLTLIQGMSHCLYAVAYSSVVTFRTVCALSAAPSLRLVCVRAYRFSFGRSVRGFACCVASVLNVRAHAAAAQSLRSCAVARSLVDTSVLLLSRAVAGLVCRARQLLNDASLAALAALDVQCVVRALSRRIVNIVAALSLLLTALCCYISAVLFLTPPCRFVAVSASNASLLYDASCISACRMASGACACLISACARVHI
jgi:hypothetical protein